MAELPVTNPHSERDAIATFLGIPVEKVQSYDDDTLESLSARMKEFTDVQNKNKELLDTVRNFQSNQLETAHDSQSGITSSNAAIAVEQESINDIKQKLNKSEETRRGLMQLLHEKVKEVNQAKSDATRSTEDNKELSEKYKQAVGTVEDTKRRNTELTLELEKTSILLNEMQHRSDSLTHQLSTKKEQYSALKDKSEQQQEEVSYNLVETESDLKVLQDDNARLIKENEDITKKSASQAAEIKELEDVVSLVKDEHEYDNKTQKTMIDTLEDQVKNLNKKLHTFFGDGTSSIDSYITRYNETCDELELIKKKLEKSEDIRVHLEAEVTRLEIDNDAVSDDSNQLNDSTMSNNPESKRALFLLRKELKHTKSEKLQLENQVKLLIDELEQKLPIVTELSERSSSLERDLSNGKLLLEHTSNDNQKKTSEILRQNKYISDLSQQINVLKTQRRHLANQVWYLLISGEIQGDRNIVLNKNEQKYLEDILHSGTENITSSDSALVISQNFVKFRNVAELQQQNMKLLTTIDALSTRAEELEETNGQLKVESESRIIQEARDIILNLESRNNELEDQVSLLESGKSQPLLLTDGSSDATAVGVVNYSKELKEIKNKYDDELSELQNKLKNALEQSKSESRRLGQEILELKNSNSDLTSNLTQEKSHSDFAQQQISVLQNSIDTIRLENKQLIMRNNHLVETISKYDRKITNSLREYASCKSELSATEVILKNLQSEYKLVSDARDAYKSDLATLREEKSASVISLSKSENLMIEMENLWKRKESQYKETITELNAKISELSQKMVLNNNELKDILLNRDQENQWYKDALSSSKLKNDEANSQITALKAEIESNLSSINALERAVNDKEARINFYKAQNFSEEETIRKRKLQEELQNVRISLQQSTQDLEKYKSETANLRASAENSRLTNERDIQEKQSLITQLQQSLEESTIGNQKLRDDLADKEKISTSRINDLEQSNTKMQGAINDFEKNTDLYEEKLADLTRQIEEANSVAQTSQLELEKASSQVAELQSNVSRLNEEIIKQSAQQGVSVTENEHRIGEFEKTITTLTNERDNLQNKGNQLEAEVQKLTSKIESLESSSSDNSNSPDNATTSEVASMVMKLTKENSELISELSNVKASEKISKEETLRLQSELDALTVKSRELDSKLTSLETTSNEGTAPASVDNPHPEELISKLSDYERKLSDLQTQLDNATSLVAQKEDVIQTLQSKNEILQRDSSRQSPIDIEMVDASENSSDREITDSKELLKQNQELEDELDKLKQETNEKLSDSKHSSLTLLEELEHLKQEKHALETKLVDEEAKVSSLEERMTGIGNEESSVVTDLQKELENSKIHSKEIEAMLNATMETSNKLTEKLSTEIANLKSELEESRVAEFNGPLTTDETDEYGKIIEEMKKSFEEEKIDFMHKKEEEYNSKVQELEERLKALSKGPEEGSQPSSEEPQNVDIEALKKEWTEQYEGTVLQRIEEAEEALKRRIRLPTEEKINSIVERHKSDIDKSFHDRVDEKARELINTPEFEGVLNDIKSKISLEMKESFETSLKESQKKSFEEGQRQAMMKTTLLQRKISSLENQLRENQERSSSVEQPEAGNDTEVIVDNKEGSSNENDSPDKQTVPSNNSFARLTASPFGFGNSPFSSQDSGLFKNSEPAQPATIERNDLKSNPFATSFTSSPSNSNIQNPFGKYRPTFSLNSNSVKDDTDASESVADSTLGSKRSADDDDQSDNSDAKRSKGGIS